MNSKKQIVVVVSEPDHYSFPDEFSTHAGVYLAIKYTNYSKKLQSLWAKARKHEKRHKWGRDYPKDAMLDKSFKLHPTVKKILSAFKSTKPWKTTNKEFLNNAQKLYVELSKFYDMPCPALRHKGPWKGNSSKSYYEPHGVTLCGKKSIITLLHEFVHARGYGEQGAVWWSINAFKIIWPKQFSKLRAAKNLPYKPRK